MKEAVLHLENGLEFQGYSFGYEFLAEGEVVFSTSMVGYPEALTDPNYEGQILCITYPLIGNYGVPDDNKENGISLNYESDKIHVKGVIVLDYSFNYSHWNAVKSLDQWLKENKIPGIYGVDTREITKYLRDHGAQLGAIIPRGFNTPSKFYNPNLENQVAKVSCSDVIKYGKEGGKKVVLVDCGVNNSILRRLVSRDIELIRVPWDYDFNTLEYDGVIVSNGPGNPEYCTQTVKNIQVAMEKKRPVFGICMGNQLLAKAAGAKTIKLPYGHRSHNQPVRLAGTEKCYITSQNHGYAVDHSSLNADWEPMFINMNDGTNEGIRHKSGLFFGVQFYPDNNTLFDDFLNLL